MKILLNTSLYLLFCFSQQQKNIEHVATALCNPYFSYDKVEYYHTDLTRKEIDKVILKDSPTVREQNMNVALTGPILDFSSDTAFYAKLTTLTFKKNFIPTTLFPQLNEVFCEPKTEDKELSAMCTPNYRDILIFKKQNKTIGIAKICFTCQETFIIGADKKIHYFKQQSDFDKLKQILSKT